jgi:hypothetical protein
MKQFDRALRCLEPSRAQCVERFEENRENGRVAIELANVVFDIGDVRAHLGDVDGAACEYREVVAVCDAAGLPPNDLAAAAHDRLVVFMESPEETATDQ